MSDNLPTYQSLDLSCPFCDRVISAATQIARSYQGGMRKGAITVCSNCGNPSMLGDSGLRKIKTSEMNAMDKPTKSAVIVAIQGVKALLAKKN